MAKPNVCFDFSKRGSCSRAQCSFLHEQTVATASPQHKVCFDFSKPGGCLRANCPFSHEPQAKPLQRKICFDFSKPGGCFRVNCPFSHELQAKPLRPTQPKPQPEADIKPSPDHLPLKATPEHKVCFDFSKPGGCHRVACPFSHDASLAPPKKVCFDASKPGGCRRMQCPFAHDAPHAVNHHHQQQKPDERVEAQVDHLPQQVPSPIPPCPDQHLCVACSCARSHPPHRRPPCLFGALCCVPQCPHLHPVASLLQQLSAVHAAPLTGEARFIVAGIDAAVRSHSARMQTTAAAIDHHLVDGSAGEVPAAQRAVVALREAFDGFCDAVAGPVRVIASATVPLSSSLDAQYVQGVVSAAQCAMREAHRLHVAAPILAARTRIEAAVLRGRCVVVHGPPGAGASSQVPQYLAELMLRGALPGRRVLCTQPKSLAAALHARRVAGDWGVGLDVGSRSVGGAISFRDVATVNVSEATVVEYVTEAAMLPLVRAGGVEGTDLGGVAAVVVDEGHRRSWLCEMVLALLRQGQANGRWPNLRIIVLSSSFQSEQSLSRLLTPCDVVSFSYDGACKTIDHVVVPKAKPTAACVAAALRLHQDVPGREAILVFVPSAHDAERAVRAFDGAVRRLGVQPATAFALHEDLTPDDAWRIVAPAHPSAQPMSQPSPELITQLPAQAARRVIFTTSLAESLHVAGVGVVVDGGQDTTLAYDLDGAAADDVGPITRDAAETRCWAAGISGRCVRLYSTETAVQLREAMPNKNQEPFTVALLHLYSLRMMGSSFPWLDHVSRGAIQAAENELFTSGLVCNHELTHLGRCVQELKVSPLQGRLLKELATAGAGAMVGPLMVGLMVHAREILTAAGEKIKPLIRAHGDGVTLLRVCEQYLDILKTPTAQTAPQVAAENGCVAIEDGEPDLVDAAVVAAVAALSMQDQAPANDDSGDRENGDDGDDDNHDATIGPADDSAPALATAPAPALTSALVTPTDIDDDAPLQRMLLVTQELTALFPASSLARTESVIDDASSAMFPAADITAARAARDWCAAHGIPEALLKRSLRIAQRIIAANERAQLLNYSQSVPLSDSEISRVLCVAFRASVAVTVGEGLFYELLGTSPNLARRVAVPTWSCLATSVRGGAQRPLWVVCGCVDRSGPQAEMVFCTPMDTHAWITQGSPALAAEMDDRVKHLRASARIAGVGSSLAETLFGGSPASRLAFSKTLGAEASYDASKREVTLVCPSGTEDDATRRFHEEALAARARAMGNVEESVVDDCTGVRAVWGAGGVLHTLLFDDDFVAIDITVPREVPRQTFVELCAKFGELHSCDVEVRQRLGQEAVSMAHVVFREPTAARVALESLPKVLSATHGPQATVTKWVAKDVATSAVDRKDALRRSCLVVSWATAPSNGRARLSFSDHDVANRCIAEIGRSLQSSFSSSPFFQGKSSFNQLRCFAVGEDSTPKMACIGPKPKVSGRAPARVTRGGRTFEDVQDPTIDQFDIKLSNLPTWCDEHYLLSFIARCKLPAPFSCVVQRGAPSLADGEPDVEHFPPGPLKKDTPKHTPTVLDPQLIWEAYVPVEFLPGLLTLTPAVGSPGPGRACFELFFDTPQNLSEGAAACKGLKSPLVNGQPVRFEELHQATVHVGASLYERLKLELRAFLAHVTKGRNMTVSILPPKALRPGEVAYGVPQWRVMLRAAVAKDFKDVLRELGVILSYTTLVATAEERAALFTPVGLAKMESQMISRYVAPLVLITGTNTVRIFGSVSARKKAEKALLAVAREVGVQLSLPCATMSLHVFPEHRLQLLSVLSCVKLEKRFNLFSLVAQGSNLFAIGSELEIAQLREWLGDQVCPAVAQAHLQRPPRTAASDIDAIECGICFCPITDPAAGFELIGCGHVFCVDCMRHEFAAADRQQEVRLPLECWVDGCGAPYAWRDILALTTPVAKAFVKSTLLERYLASRTSQLMRCVGLGCSQIIQRSSFVTAHTPPDAMAQGGAVVSSDDGQSFCIGCSKAFLGPVEAYKDISLDKLEEIWPESAPKDSMRRRTMEEIEVMMINRASITFDEDFDSDDDPSYVKVVTMAPGFVFGVDTREYYPKRNVPDGPSMSDMSG